MLQGVSHIVSDSKRVFISARTKLSQFHHAIQDTTILRRKIFKAPFFNREIYCFKLCCLYIRPSVRPPVRPPVIPSRFRVLSKSFEPLVRLTNNCRQMSSIISQCALRMFEQGRFLVKVKVQG